MKARFSSSFLSPFSLLTKGLLDLKRGSALDRDAEENYTEQDDLFIGLSFPT